MEALEMNLNLTKFKEFLNNPANAGYTFKGEKTGDWFIKISIQPRREVGQYGDTHTAKVSRRKEDGSWDNTYINGVSIKTKTFGQPQQQTAQAQEPFKQEPIPTNSVIDAPRVEQNTQSSIQVDDLPF